MSIEYSTMPRAFLGANSISVMIALRGSAGPTSPKACPLSFSYWPTSPKDVPSNVGDWMLMMTSLVMRASAGPARPTTIPQETTRITSADAMMTPLGPKALLFIFISDPPRSPADD